MPSRDASGSDTLLAGKTCFDDIYDRPDPDDYYGKLGEFEYQIPHHAQRILQTLLAARGEDRPQVLDLCCSYGINAALLRHRLTLADLYAHYGAPERDAARGEETLARDRAFFAKHRLPQPPRVVGVDVAEHAVGYAVRTGLLDDGFVENLERTPPTSALRDAVADVGLVTVTGGVGYITHETFRRVLDCVATPPWVAAFVLRGIDYRPIAEALASYGLVTEALPDRTFPQRRFASEVEARSTLDSLASAGISATGKESAGYYHANLYVSRPARETRERPLARLLYPD